MLGNLCLMNPIIHKEVNNLNTISSPVIGEFIVKLN